jgi:DNA polymerase bacteriophage-type
MSLDYETFCEESLPDVGTHVYATHSSAEVLMAAWAFDDGEIAQWPAAEGYPMPAEFEDAVLDDRIEKWAWNTPFEMMISENVLGLPIRVESWRDTMVQAMHNSLPGSLEKAGPVVDLEVDKLKDRRGKVLMRKFSFPRKPTKNDPRTRVLWHEAFDDWLDYLAYNRQDVETERAVRRRTFPMPQDEWETWFLDQRINRAGLPINTRMVRNAILTYETALGSAAEGTGAFGEMAEITGLPNPNSPAQLLPWMQDRGYPYDDCKKGHIRTALAYFSTRPEHWGEERWQLYRARNDLKRILELRLASARTSIKKS